MSRKLALTREQSTALVAWHDDYKRIGTLAEKCRELGIDPRTARNEVARIKGGDTTYTRQKIAELLDELASVPRETV